MKIIHFNSTLHFLNNYRDLQETILISLCAESVSAIDDAYAPYSNYKVGASILFDNDQIIRGCNQENAVYPLGLCAERVALFTAGSQHIGLKIKALAVATTKELIDEELAPFPCGSCRQVILEFEERQGSDIALYIVGSNESVCYTKSVKEILPFSFGKDKL